MDSTTISNLLRDWTLQIYGIATSPSVEVPNDEIHGDFATNLPLIISKQVMENPITVANRLVDFLQKSDLFESVKIAGSGFINFTLKKSDWHTVLQSIIKSENLFPTLSSGERVHVEFVSVNPTGPLHIGHARGAVYGDVLCNLLQKTGFNVFREYYINDAGKQVDVLAESLYLHCRNLYCKDNADIPEHCYPGQYLVDIASSFLKENPNINFSKEDTKEKYNAILKKYAISSVMNIITEDLEKLGIKFDLFTSEEKDVIPMLWSVLDQMQKNNLLYRGVLDAPKGMKDEDWELSEQLLFKSSKFGDDSDRPVLRSDGSFTYFAGDIAYHKHKLDRGFKKLFLILGRDHIGYIKRIESVVRALSDGSVPIVIKAMELVKIKDKGNYIKMSKRSGNFITVADVQDEIGKDALRFSILTKRNDTGLDIDIEKLKEQSKNNPLFYIQYAHARACSILRKVQFSSEMEIPLVDFASDEELKLLKKISRFSYLISDMVNTYSLHKITYYLEELALSFHQLWSKGNKDESMRFVIENEQSKTLFRVAIVYAFAKTLKSGLSLLGIEALESM